MVRIAGCHDYRGSLTLFLTPEHLNQAGRVFLFYIPMLGTGAQGTWKERVLAWVGPETRALGEEPEPWEGALGAWVGRYVL